MNPLRCAALPVLALWILSLSPVTAQESAVAHVEHLVRYADGLCVREDQYLAAIEVYTKALALDPSSTAALVGRADCLEKTFQRDLAIADLTSALAVEPLNLRLRLRRGHLAFSEGKAATAEQDFSLAIALCKAGGQTRLLEDCHFALGRTYAMLGEPEKALGCYQDAEAASTVFRASIVLARARACVACGRLEDAIVDFRRAVQVGPESAYVLAELATVLEATGDLVGALRAINRAVELYRDEATRPRSVHPIQRRAIIRSGMQDLDGALEDIEAALRASPQDDQLLIDKLGILVENHQYDAALAMAAVAINGTSARAREFACLMATVVSALDERHPELPRVVLDCAESLCADNGSSWNRTWLRVALGRMPVADAAKEIQPLPRHERIERLAELSFYQVIGRSRQKDAGEWRSGMRDVAAQGQWQLWEHRIAKSILGR